MNDAEYKRVEQNCRMPAYKEIHISSEAKLFLGDFVDPINSRLEELEAAVLACEKGNDYKENFAVMRRIVHTIKGEAGIIGLNDVYELCHQIEYAFEENIEAEKLTDLLLRFKDWLGGAALYLLSQTSDVGSKPENNEVDIERTSKMKVLIVEDDFTTRKLMQRYISAYGECDIAVDGVEAIAAFRQAMEEKTPYDLICLDIIMPNVNGHEALKTIRHIENSHGIIGLDCVKIIMTTVLGDSKNIIGAFKEGCEAYIVKPIDKKRLIEEIEKLCMVSLKAN